MKRCFILILAAALCLSGCGKQEKEASAQIFAMDTVMEIAAFGPQAEEAVSETESQIQELEKQLSRTLPDSDVSRINQNGTTPTTGIAAGTWALLEAALEYGDATDGAFDITIAPVMDAWGFTGDSFPGAGAGRAGRATQARQQRRNSDAGRIHRICCTGGRAGHRPRRHRQGLYLRSGGADLPGPTALKWEDLTGGQRVRAGNQAGRLRLAGGHQGSAE